MSESPDFIPLAMMNAYAYCPRRFYYEFTLGEMVVNEFVLSGQHLHERVDQTGQVSRDNKLQLHRVYLCAPRLGLSGYCDLVEAVTTEEESARLEPPALASLAEAGRLYPVEYKKGKLGKWLSDHVQLCAQALALEESLQVAAGSIGQGYLFYFGSARRETVGLDEELRTRTLTLLAEARLVARQPDAPRPITNGAKCRDCSLEEICLPREVLAFETKHQRLSRLTEDEDEPLTLEETEKEKEI